MSGFTKLFVTSIGAMRCRILSPHSQARLYDPSGFDSDSVADFWVFVSAFVGKFGRDLSCILKAIV